MNRTRILIAATVVVAATLAALLGGALRGETTAAAQPQALAEAFQASFSTAKNTPALVADLEAAVTLDDAGAATYTLLGLAYQQRARETGDPTFYGRSEAALRRALALDDGDPLALSALGSLALSRHRFADALELGRRAAALAPQAARHYGVVGDALLELGRYREAFATFDRMARLKPGVASYARISHARELRGDMRGAIDAMQLAVDASVGSAEPSAWTYTQLGQLYWNGGRVAEAVRSYRAALAYFPGYAPALDALARAEAARGNVRGAIALARRASVRTPVPQYVALLGDLYRAAGDDAAARGQYALVRTIERLLNANGVRTDVELAVFNADHRIRLSQTLQRARLAYAAAPSTTSADAVAWTLYRKGRCVEARAYSVRALRLGTQDALTFFHRGMIERCLGNAAASRMWLVRALETNPHFSVRWAPVARKLS